MKQESPPFAPGAAAHAANRELHEALDRIAKVVLGKPQQIRLALSCFLADGHLLIEDLPGLGKTTLAHALARVMGLQFERVQFTSDLLPGDISGVSVFDPKQGEFHFHQGPIFTQLLLADEINRSTPKTQSALLEAMEERQVSTEGQTRKLPEPFFVIATQNPLSQVGTFPLPESQLDRFLMCITLGYPDAAAERRILEGQDPRTRLPELRAVFTGPEHLARLQQQVLQQRVSESLLDYVQRLVSVTRHNEAFPCGLSPRGAMALLRAARAWSLFEQRDYVLPDDVQAVLPAVLEHRVQGYGAARIHGEQDGSLSRRLLSLVDVVER